jgi:hypothetical protein
VLRAYGWNDLADRAAPEFIEQDADEGKTPKTRFDWPAEFKDEVLARLLALNAERAAAERAAGLSVILEDEDDDIDEAAVAAIPSLNKTLVLELARSEYATVTATRTLRRLARLLECRAIAPDGRSDQRRR